MQIGFSMNKGIVYGIGAYLIWGFFPIYIKLLKSAAPLEILGHRIIWSFLFLMAVVLIKRQWATLVRSVTGTRTIAIYALAAFFLAINWLTYIFAVNTNHVIESSLGYFINPLISVVLGVVFLRERLRVGQWVAVAIAAAGVVYLTWEYGQLPWIALVLAMTFALYGLVKKVAPLGALHGLSLETGILLIPALIFLLWLQFTGEGSFGTGGIGFSLLLASAGVVTAVPLLLFGSAARLIPLSMIGILQYIAPTCQFLIGVLIYHEPFSLTRLVGFAIIWIALALFWIEGYSHHRKAQSGTLLSKKEAFT